MRSVTPGAVFYHPELDVLRFWAFALVFFQHGVRLLQFRYALFDSPPLVRSVVAAFEKSGGLGVDLFLLLSSYLITELLLRELRLLGALDLRSFWIRRVLRIWPLYYFFLLFAMFGVPLVLDQDFPLIHQIGFLTFTGNWTVAFSPQVRSVASILWSVSIEEQFYLTWPLVVYFFPRRLKAIAWGMLAVAVAARLWLVYSGAEYFAIWCNTFARLDPIAAGALIALYLDGRSPEWSRARRWGGIAMGTALLGLIGAFLDFTGTKALLSYPLATLACAILLLSVLRPGTKPSNRVLVKLGRISYGLYVYHALGVTVVKTFWPAAPVLPVVLLQFTLAFVVTTLAALFSYRYLESPFLRLKDRFTYVRSRPE